MPPLVRPRYTARGLTIFILLCGLRKAMVIPAFAGIQREGCRGSTHHRPVLVTPLEKF